MQVVRKLLNLMGVEKHFSLGMTSVFKFCYESLHKFCKTQLRQCAHDQHWFLRLQHTWIFQQTVLYIGAKNSRLLTAADMTGLSKIYKDNHYREFSIEDMANFKGIGELLIVMLASYLK